MGARAADELRFWFQPRVKIVSKSCGEGQQHGARGSVPASAKGNLAENRGTYAGTRPRTARATAEATLSTNQTSLVIVALLAASAVSAHAQSNWTGEVSSNWFLIWQLGPRVVPRRRNEANINRYAKSDGNGIPGAIAEHHLRRSRRQFGHAYRPKRRDVDQCLRGDWQCARFAGYGHGDRRGLQLDEYRKPRGRRPGHGHAYHPKRRYGEQWWRRLRRIARLDWHGDGDRPGLHLEQRSSGGLNIGSFGTGTLMIANGGMVNNTTPVSANIGKAVGSQGTVTVTGAGSTWSNSSGGEHRQLWHWHAHDCGRRHCQRGLL